MPDKPDTWAWLGSMLESFWPAVYTVALALLVGAFRIIYEGGRLRQVLIEAPLLGLAALVFSHGVALLGISQDAAPFFGGMVGLIGVESTRALGMRILNIGVDKNDKS